MSEQDWYAISGNEAVQRLDSHEQGLAQQEAEQRLQREGPNSIGEGEQITWWQVLLRQFLSPLIYILVGAFIVTCAIQHWGDAIVIGLVLLINTVVGFLQEYKAENAIQALMQLVTPKATVRRDGDEREIDSEQLVPGDMVLLEQGRMVPADCRLLQSNSLQVNEAALTGESVPVQKDIEVLKSQNNPPQPAEQRNMAFMSTAVTSGSAKALVVATGEATQVGRIAQGIREAGEGQTPLQARMDRLARFIAYAILIISAITFAIGYFLLGRSVVEMFLMAVALAVSAMPAGLPVVMTAALAISVQRMARRHAVIRHLPAVETLGSTTAVVSDKTGTLTRNQMTTRAIWSDQQHWQVSGAALHADGRIEQDEEAVETQEGSPLHRTLLVGLLNNEAEWRETGNDQQQNDNDDDEADVEKSGDPLEIALLVAAAKAGMDREQLNQRYERIDAVPFSSERRYAATMHKDPDGGDSPLVFIKGAPETILDMCDRVAASEGDQDLDRDAVNQAANELAGEGLRLLAMCEGRGDELARAAKDGEPHGCTLLGFQGLMDPPRPEAVDAVDACHHSGIRVIMVTGDHARTAGAIASMVHIDRPARYHEREHSDELEVVEGSAFDSMDDDAFARASNRVDVFARVRPEQKLRLVKQLKADGGVVAVTGDGVNDAPALKAAHLGVAMGVSGTDVAKQASEMVLTDDNFATIEGAIEEGRTAFRNIRMATFFLLSTGLAEIIAILASLGLNWPLPLLPAQILWLNVVTNGIEDVALAFEPNDPELADRLPRPSSEGILSRLLIERTFLVGIWLALGTLGVFAWEYYSEAGTDYARAATLTMLVLFQIFHVFNCRSEYGSIFSTPLLRNKILFFGAALSLLIHIGAMYWTWTQDLLDLQPLTWQTWLLILVLAITVIPINELLKKFRKPKWAR